MSFMFAVIVVIFICVISCMPTLVWSWCGVSPMWVVTSPWLRGHSRGINRLRPCLLISVYVYYSTRGSLARTKQVSFASPVRLHTPDSVTKPMQEFPMREKAPPNHQKQQSAQAPNLTVSMLLKCRGRWTWISGTKAPSAKFAGHKNVKRLVNPQ